ncbi:MAG: hypothetical protein CMH36_03810 [Microbacterium sp.]|nr:hypothetical protein [Microbacterium sp.]
MRGRAPRNVPCDSARCCCGPSGGRAAARRGPRAWAVGRGGAEPVKPVEVGETARCAVRAAPYVAERAVRQRAARWAAQQAVRQLAVRRVAGRPAAGAAR